MFWGIVIVIFMIRDHMLNKHEVLASLVRQLCFLIPQAIGGYFFGYYLIPKYVRQKNSVFYLIIIALFTIYLTSVLGRYLIVHVSEDLWRTSPFEKESFPEIMIDWKKLLFNYFPAIYSVVFAFLFLRFFVHYTKTKEAALQLEKEKVSRELDALKAQLNPHFLFNTLNNIYVLAIENSSKTAYSIERLSEILDYVLYRCNTPYVSLFGEIKMLENYIALEKLRYDDRLQVTLTNNSTQDVQIAPLMLLSFVENTFKHGAGEDSGSPKIDIFVSYAEGVFVFEISNSVQTIGKEEDREKIGLSNSRKQLELLYPNQHSLIIDHRANWFTVQLKIKITDEN